MAPMTAAFTADIEHFAAARGLDLVRFAKGQRKDDLTREYLRGAETDDRGLVPAQVLYAGVAQEKQKVFRTSKRRNPVTGATSSARTGRGDGRPVRLRPARPIKASCLTLNTATALATGRISLPIARDLEHP